MRVGRSGGISAPTVPSDARLNSVGPRSANCQHCGASTLARVFLFREFFLFYGIFLSRECDIDTIVPQKH